ncbi:MAG: hypothetical protein HN368_00800 [Spirochaetales bacterium]|nr:hypothetical protein [Spirochaetales bacterium]
MTRNSAAAFDLYIRTRNYYTRSVAVIATIRSRMTRIPYGDQVHCLRSDLYHQLGGYRDIPIMEDVDLMTRLKHRGHKIAYTHTFAVNPDRRWKKEGPVRATLRDWYLMLAYRSGRSVKNLARLYRPHIEAKSQK